MKLTYEDRLLAERDRLKEINKELLEACKVLLADLTHPNTAEEIRTGPHVKVLQTVIDKAEGRE